MTTMEKKVSLNIQELIRLLEKIEGKELTTTQLNKLNDKVEELNEWLYRKVLYPPQIFF